VKKLALLFSLVSVAVGAAAEETVAVVDRGAYEAAYANAHSPRGCGLAGALRDTLGIPLVCGGDGKWFALKTEVAEERTALNPAAYGCIILGPDGRKLNLAPVVGRSGTATFFPKGTGYTPACLSPN
jgi:hypothetical protein